METKASANHLTSVAILANADIKTSLSVIDGSLEMIQEAVSLFGGIINLPNIDDETDRSYLFITCASKIGNCHLWIHSQTNKLAIMLQKDALQSSYIVFEKGTQLTIIDNQYLVLSDASK
jgi:hypothetical protein